MSVKNNFKIIIVSLVAIVILSVIITVSLFKAFESEQAKISIPEVSSAAVIQKTISSGGNSTSQPPEVKTKQQEDEIEFEGKIKGPLLQ
jgi:hypothetical protein